MQYSIRAAGSYVRRSGGINMLLRSYLKFLILIILCGFTFNSAQAEYCTGKLNRVKIFFGNGMFNSTKDTNDSLSVIRVATKKYLKNFKLSYDISYNHKEYPLIELLEVTKHKMQDNWQSLLLWLRGRQLAPNWFKKQLKQVVRRHSVRAYAYDADLRRHVENYRASILNCQKVIIVAHSQGNFYANHAWNNIYSLTLQGISLDRIKPLGIVGVAAPTHMIGSPLYYSGFQDDAARFVTLKSDVVINAVRAVNPATINGNTKNRKESHDWKNHSFIDAYMAGSPSRQRILTFIKQLAYNLETLPYHHIPITTQPEVLQIGYDPINQVLEEQLTDDSIWRCYHTPTWFIDFGFASDVGADPDNLPEVDYDELNNIRCLQVKN